jgi:MOSC domain-containing protein YiiM
VAGPVWARRLNLDGDGQADLRVHGGEHKAVYAYPSEHYAFWARELARNDLVHGQFGENLTVEGLLEVQVNIGDVFRVGEALLQVSQPRSPCFKLGIRMGDESFPARFTAENRTGFYLRVLEEGRIAAGDAIQRIEQGETSISVRDAFRLRHGSGGTRAEYERGAQVSALTPNWRAAFEKKLSSYLTSPLAGEGRGGGDT